MYLQNASGIGKKEAILFQKPHANLFLLLSRESRSKYKSISSCGWNELR